MNYWLIGIVLLGTSFLALAEVDRVVREAEADPADQTPKTPAAPPAPPKTTAKLSFEELKLKYNIADDVSEDYPIIFNIILFISVSLILALIAISVSIATMDPGRDSLIYRVTSAQRYKKDN